VFLAWVTSGKHFWLTLGERRGAQSSRVQKYKNNAPEGSGALNNE
jgi:hypothetical protein